MIFVDENIDNNRIINMISTWYSGHVASILSLRPSSLIKDESIPTLLLTANNPTFVTINVTDFWQKVQVHRAYCIIGIALPQNRMFEVPTILRSVLQLPEFKTKHSRMGRMVHVRHKQIEYYEANRQIRTIAWPD